MGKHSVQPTKTDIVHKSGRVMRTRTHVFLVFCKHTIMELPAGLIAILLFESNRGGWLHMIGNDKEATEHAIRAFQHFM